NLDVLYRSTRIVDIIQLDDALAAPVVHQGDADAMFSGGQAQTEAARIVELQGLAVECQGHRGRLAESRLAQRGSPAGGHVDLVLGVERKVVAYQHAAAGAERQAVDVT